MTKPQLPVDSDNFISRATPYPELLQMMKRLDGDIMLLGAGGKIGPSLAMLADIACRQAKVKKQIIAVDINFDEKQEHILTAAGIKLIRCDLLNLKEVQKLPQVKNIIFLVGRKFGELGSEPLTWLINVIVPNNVAQTFKESNIVAFSTGCVYALTSPKSGGSKETDPPAPIGEYAHSCLARERIFEYYSKKYGTKVLLFRLNYAVEKWYGVLVDIAEQVYARKPVDLTVSWTNVIWQEDAINRALLCLAHTASPPKILNVTGKEILSVKYIAQQFGTLFNVPVTFTGTDSGKAYLSNPSQSYRLFGAPKVSVSEMITMIADWIQHGGKLLGKPTHFQVTDGQFLDKK
ncbi:MAG: NAD-dependent epimerase/dehydratase family protein [bacterium]|nr:NAD-dependent epimerase/dehydratase family protein [bacterium]